MAFKKLLTLMYSNLVDHPLAMLVRQTCERKKKISISLAGSEFNQRLLEFRELLSPLEWRPF